ncbi:hypothetical protein [Kordia periserrulae]|nr:hypothetical protein [Kordia periserrulae]
MKKQILSIGKVLSKKEQRIISGGIVTPEPIDSPCEEPVLAPPPEGCRYIKIAPCSYRLVCLQITPL